MCLFVGDVDRVSATSIFARMLGERQLVVYSMTYAAQNPLAMVLPVPVLPGAPEHAVSFISLEGCPDFFSEMRNGFASGKTEGAVIGGVATAGRVLEVKKVGAYEASFVPRPEDFARLDERFRLPPELWLTLNHYRDWGFAVFKLREAVAPSGVHPMAFTYPTRERSRLFFPTLHMHHGRLEKSAEFDHALYSQPAPAMHWHLQEWSESHAPAGEFMRCAAARALLALEYPCWRTEVIGRRENRDTWLGKGEQVPARG